MHVETYPAFLTPRDKKLSLSSSVEKSSEFGWLEIKRNENEREGKTEQGSVYSIYLYIYILIDSTYFSLFYNGCKGIYREVFPTFLAKKSYG